MSEDKKTTSYRLSDKHRELLSKHAEKDRRTRVVVLELLIEKAAAEAGIK